MGWLHEEAQSVMQRVYTAIALCSMWSLDRRRAVCALYEQSLHIAVLYSPPEEGASLGGTCLFKGGESWGRDSATGGQLPTLLIP